MRFTLLAAGLSLLSVVFADTNTTIPDTDSSIQYSDGGHSLPCLLDDEGNFLPGQGGCFNNGPKNCSAGAHVLQQQKSTLSMLFKGSAIYMNSLLDDISNVYTVTLDGKSTDIDGVRPGGLLVCETLFSQTGLDPTVEHNISVAIKGLSPTRNTTLGNDNTFFLWLDDFIVTTPSTSSNTSSSESASTGASATQSGASASPSPSTGGAVHPSAPYWLPLGVAALFILISA